MRRSSYGVCLYFQLSVFLIWTCSGAFLQQNHIKSYSHRRKTTTLPAKNPWKKHDAALLQRVYSKDKIPSSPDYIIIGSGIGGLWLGACLAKFNITSVVLEQHYIAGGFQHTFVRKGYEFVPGLHYIANLDLCAPLYDMVADPAIDLRYNKAGASVPADNHNHCSHDLKIGNLPVLHVRQGTQAARDELVKTFPEEESAIEEFIRLMERAKWQAGQFATFKIFPPLIQFLMSQLVCSSYVRFASMTTEQVLSRLTSDGRLKTVLSAFGGDLGESITEGSFVMQAAVLGHVLEGCYYPEGGPIQFARGLVPTIRNAGGDVLVKARVEQILVEENQAIGVRLANGDEILSKKGVVSDAGMRSTLKLLPNHIVSGRLSKRWDAVERSSGGISHVFAFVGLNASHEELGLRSSSFYYIPCNATKDMDASAIQDFYRDTLLDPKVDDVSAGIVFCSAKDPHYSSVAMPNKSTVIIFSEARDSDFLKLFPGDTEHPKGISDPGHTERSQAYMEAKALVERKMMRSLLTNFPHLEPFVDVVEVGTPLTLLDYTLRSETLGLRHTPERMCNMDLRPDCDVKGLYFTGQDVAFAGWAGALAGAMVTAQKLLGYTLWDFVNGKTLLRDLGYGEMEDTIQARVQESTKASPWEVVLEIAGNAIRHIQRQLSIDTS